MYEVAVLVNIALLFAGAVDYIRRMWICETNPVPATWILMMVMMTLTFWMYWESPQKSWTANIAVTYGVVQIGMILAGVIATNIRYRTLSVAFDKVQKWCLVGGGGVVVFWAFTDEPLISYCLVQVIALVAFFATVQRLWKAERSTEPLFLWIVSVLANLCALYPAWVKNDLYSWIFLGRAIPCTVLVVYLILRIKRKMCHATEFVNA